MEPANIAGTADSLKEDAEIKSPKLDSAIDDFSKSLWGALKRSKCAVTGSVVKRNSSAPGSTIAEVKYECLVPEVAPGVRHHEGPWEIRPQEERTLSRVLPSAGECIQHGAIDASAVRIGQPVWQFEP